MKLLLMTTFAVVLATPLYAQNAYQILWREEGIGPVSSTSNRGDMDGDGVEEIIQTRVLQGGTIVQVLDALTGGIKWAGILGTGSLGLIDVDTDGTPELLLSFPAFAPDGSGNRTIGLVDFVTGPPPTYGQPPGAYQEIWSAQNAEPVPPGAYHGDPDGDGRIEIITWKRFGTSDEALTIRDALTGIVELDLFPSDFLPREAGMIDVDSDGTPEFWALGDDQVVHYFDFWPAAAAVATNLTTWGQMKSKYEGDNK